METNVLRRLKRHILGCVSRTPCTMQPWGAPSQPDVVVSSTSTYTLHAKRIGLEHSQLDVYELSRQLVTSASGVQVKGVKQLLN
jgi:hypothetical protein